MGEHVLRTGVCVTMQQMTLKRKEGNGLSRLSGQRESKYTSINVEMFSISHYLLSFLISNEYKILSIALHYLFYKNGLRYT